jgi:hypothetical protein
MHVLLLILKRALYDRAHKILFRIYMWGLVFDQREQKLIWQIFAYKFSSIFVNCLGRYIILAGGGQTD